MNDPTTPLTLFLFLPILGYLLISKLKQLMKREREEDATTRNESMP
jgi:hypothetical protein